MHFYRVRGLVIGQCLHHIQSLGAGTLGWHDDCPIELILNKTVASSTSRGLLCRGCAEAVTLLCECAELISMSFLQQFWKDLDRLCGSIGTDKTQFAAWPCLAAAAAAAAKPASRRKAARAATSDSPSSARAPVAAQLTSLHGLPSSSLIIRSELSVQLPTDAVRRSTSAASQHTKIWMCLPSGAAFSTLELSSLGQCF